MTRPLFPRRTAAATLAVAVVVTGAGCAFDPAAVPIPGGTVSGPSYPVHIEFTDALNLPQRAKVIADGVQIGNLTGMRVIDPSPSGPGRVVADVDITSAVTLPASTTAQLRQNTVLGDVYVALNTTPDGSAIPSGGTIPLARTEPGRQIEDLLAGLAVFVGGGAVGHMQAIVQRVNSVLPADPGETARIFGTLGADVRDIAANLDGLDDLGVGIRANLAVVQANAGALEDLLNDTGVRRATTSIKALMKLLGVIGGIGGIVSSITWLRDLVTAGDAAATAVVPLLFTARPFDLSAPSNLNKLISLLTERIIPFVTSGPEVNITGVTVPGGASSAPAEQAGQIVAVLRIMGVVR